jgi:hypothetical protein
LKETVAPVAGESVLPWRALTWPISSVAAEATVVVPVPMAEAAFATTVPALSAAPPEKVLAAESVSLPAPVLVRLPMPARLAASDTLPEAFETA